MIIFSILASLFELWLDSYLGKEGEEEVVVHGIELLMEQARANDPK